MDSKVISGKYSGCVLVKGMFSSRFCLAGCLPFFNVELSPKNIINYQLVGIKDKVNGTSAVLRGAVGAALIGPVGLLAALGAKKDNGYNVLIKWKGGGTSLLQIKEEDLASFIQSISDCPQI